MLIADMQYGQVFLMPSKKMTDGKPELVYSIIDDEQGKKRILSTMWVQGYTCAVVHNGVFIRNGDEKKETLFRYEVTLASLDEHAIDIPDNHLFGSPRQVFTITKEMNENALRLRNRYHQGTDPEDDEYYSQRMENLAKGGQLTMGNSTTTPAPFVHRQPARPAKKTLLLVQVDVDSYLNN